MNNWWIVFCLFIFFAIIMRNKKEKKIIIKQHIMRKRNKKESVIMIELAKKFIGKKCLIYTFDTQVTGVINEVTDGGVLIDNNGSIEVLNMDFIVRIREYPKNKKGKDKSVVLD